MNLEQKIESILFFKGESYKILDLSNILKVSQSEIKEAIDLLDKNLENRGIILIQKDDEVMLSTNPQMGKLIEELNKEDLTKDLSKAALETLSVIMYRGPIKRSEIDYIRGVNSQFILRTLLIRGLIEKINDPNDERSYLYKPTFKLLEYLGIKKIEDMPEYKEVDTNIEEFLKQDVDENKE